MFIVYIEQKYVFPTCQVRVSRFYQSCFLPSLPPFVPSFLPLPSFLPSFLPSLPPSLLLLPSPSFLLLPPSSSSSSSAANSRQQWALPDLNRELISVGTALESQISLATAGPPPRAPNLSVHCRLNRELQISVGTARESQISLATAGPQPRAPNLSGHSRASTASSRSHTGRLSNRMPERMSEQMPCRMSERVSE